MATTLTIKANDTAIKVRDTIKSNGNPLVLTGATVLFSMRSHGASTNKVDGAAATIVSSTSGEVEYSFATADIDTPGNYEFEWKVTLASGKILHTPNSFLRVTSALKT